MEVITFTNNHFNNNIGESLSPQHHHHHQYSIESNDTYMIESLSKRIESELRHAKHTHFDCGEVLLPTGLTRIVANEIYKIADSELYGLNGCTIYINFEGADDIKRNLSVIRCDPTTTATFELYLTLKQTNTTAGWNSFLPQFIKKMTRGGGTVMISAKFGLEMKKLYRSSSFIE